jgi:hypothetical protein
LAYLALPGGGVILEETPMKSSLTPDEIESLLNEAEDAFPDSDFVSSVREWFEDHDFITDNQETALNNIIER